MLRLSLQLGHCARQQGNFVAAMDYFQAAAAAEPDNQWPLLETAECLRILARWDEAAPLYQQVLVLARDNARAWLGLGYCARQRGERGNAIAFFQAGALAASDNPWPRLEAAIELRQSGHAKAAEAGFRDVLTMMPGNVQAHLGLGYCVRLQSGPTASLPHFRSAAAAAPADPWPLIEAAADLRQLGELAAAEALLQGALRLAPDNVQAHLGLGHCARMRDDRAASLRCFEAAMRADPADPWPALEAAADLRQFGQLAAAEALCQAVLQARPGQVEGHLGLGLCARARAASAEALAHFQAALAADPGSATAGLEVAYEQRLSGDRAAATATAAATLRRHPNELYAMLSLAETEQFFGRHEDAYAAFAAAAAAHPGHAGALVGMALAARSLGQPAQCGALLAQALTVDPKSVLAITRFAEQALVAGEAERALALFEQASAEQPGHVEFRFGMVECLAALGRITPALAMLSDMAAAGTDLPRIAAKQLNLLRRTGDVLQALLLARTATAAHRYFFELWAERFQLEIMLSTDDDVLACMAAMPVANIIDSATMERCAGNLAERAWQIGGAIEAYEKAAALHPLDAGIQHDLVRATMLVLDTRAARQYLKRFCELTAFVARLQRKSLNLSQTHYGQIIDDYCLDAELLEILQRSQPLPAPERATALAAAIRAYPASTAASVSLLVAMRQSDTLASEPATAQHPIPMTITQFWDTAKVPADVKAIMATWPALNPGYRCNLFNDTSAIAFLRERYPPAVSQAYARVREPAQKADIFRLAYLVAEGGVYVDADDRCLAPLHSMLPPGAATVFYQEDHGTLGNNFIATVAGNKVLAHALQMGVEAINRGDTDNVWLSTGPALLTRSLAEAVAAASLPAPLLPPGMVVLHRRQLFQAVAIHCTADYKRSDRHWSNSAFARRRQPAVLNTPAG